MDWAALILDGGFTPDEGGPLVHSISYGWPEVRSGLGEEKSESIKNIISQNTKDSWDDKRKKRHSELAKDNIHNSLLSESSIIKNREYLNERWSDWRENEINIIKSFINSSNIDKLIKYLEKIPNTLFKDRKEFYEFVGSKNHILIKKELLKNKKPHKNNEKNKKKVVIGGKIYNSISEASSVNNIERSLIRYRLKSNNYPDYFYI